MARRFRGPVVLGRLRSFDLILILIFGAIAIRAIVAALPVPLIAARRQVELLIFVSSTSQGMEDALTVGEYIRYARNGTSLGRIIAIHSRPAQDSEQGRWWSAARDILIHLSTTGRYRAGRGLYLSRNLPARVGETYPLRTTLGSFWGRVERITFGAR